MKTFKLLRTLMIIIVAVISTLPSWSQDIDSLMLQFQRYYYAEEYEKAIDIGEKLLSINPEFANDTANVNYLLALAANIGFKNENVIDYYSKTKAACIEFYGENSKEVADILAYIGDCNLSQIEFEKALNHYEEAKEIYNKIEDENNVAKMSASIGKCYHYNGKYEEAIKVYNEAKMKYKKIGANDKVAEMLSLIADCYCNDGYYEEALKVFNEINKNPNKIDDDKLYAKMLSNIGNCYYYQCNYDEALKYFTDAKEIFSTTDQLYMEFETQIKIDSCISITESSHRFMVDKLCYQISDDGKSVSVICQNSDSPKKNYRCLSGNIVIPKKVKYRGKSYIVTEIRRGAFRGCTGLTSANIPNSVTEIGDGAFWECTGLTSVTIPNSVTKIGSYAFSDCTSLTSIEIPKAVTSIGDDTFANCRSLTSVTIPNSVTEIGYGAFDGCKSLTSVTIPNSVTKMGSSYTFRGCTSLTSVSIPNLVTEIGFGAFWGCTGLTSVSIGNSVTTIDYHAFSNCTSLTSVTIPNSVIEIGNGAFEDCTGLTSVSIGNSVTSIESRAFGGCTGLTSVTIPNSVTEIGAEAFICCNGLTSVVIGNSVTEIGSSAFYGCTGLASMTIPSSVISLGRRVFDGCTALTSIVSEIREPQYVIDNKNIADFFDSSGTTSTFTGVDFANCTLYIPKGTISLYENTFPWYSFISIKESFDSVPHNNETTTVDKLKLLVQKSSHGFFKDHNVIKFGEQLLQHPDFTATPDNLEVITQLAASYKLEEMYSKAKDCYEMAIGIHKSLKDDNSLKVADLYDNNGQCYFNMQKYDNAIVCFKDASAIYIDNNQNIKYANMQKMIGQCYLYQDEFDNAEDYYLEAINVYEDNNDFLKSSFCYIAIEQFDKATLSLFNSFEKVGGWELLTFRTDIQDIIQKRYDYYFDNKQYDDAINLCANAIFIYNVRSPYEYLNSRVIASFYEKTGLCYFYKNDIDSAIYCFRTARKICEEQDLDDLKYYQEQLNFKMGFCYFYKSDFVLAYNLIRGYVNSKYNKTLSDFKEITAAKRLEYWENQSSLFQNLYPSVTLRAYEQKSDNLEYGDLLGDLYNKSALFAKGLLLSSDNEFKRIIQNSKNPKMIKKFQESQNNGSNDNTIETELLIASKGLGNFMDNFMLTWDSVQAKLKPNDIAIEFLSFSKMGSGSTMYIALTVRPGYDQPHLVELCDEQELKNAATDAYTTTALSKKIWKKLADEGELDGVKNIYFSPSGLLHTIAIESMPHWKVSNSLMCNMYKICRLSSTRELAMKHSDVEGSGAVLYGGIRYTCSLEDMAKPKMGQHETTTITKALTENAVKEENTTEDSSDNGTKEIGHYDVKAAGLRDDTSLDYLQESRFEVDEIEKILNKNSKDKAEKKVDCEATETSFKNLDGQRKKIIHIATHGYYWNDITGRENNMEWQLRYENQDKEDKAMTLSGLFFGGAQNNFGKDKVEIPDSIDDGVLTALEVSHLDLRGLDLVVLSACKTGLGDIVGSEGVFGLQRGFKKAGAQAIIMSLWPVDDQATKEMMVKFYEELKDGKTYRQAFNIAQDKLKKTYGNFKDINHKEPTTRPHWAAFILLDAVE